MLIEIKSTVLRTQVIKLRPGLNVVLGDANATNSIGKSTTLMLIDFAFGGTDLLHHNHDVVTALGDHNYFFTFRWDGADYIFSRGTLDSNLVVVCDSAFNPVRTMTLSEYTVMLKQLYGIYLPDLSFRALIGPYSRIWGKDNLAVTRPLHVVQNQRSAECVDNLIKTFDQYVTIRALSQELNSASDRLKSWRAAAKHRFIPTIKKTQYLENQQRIATLESELADIKENLAKYATNLSEVVDKQILELKAEKDQLLIARLETSGRLQRIQSNLRENRAIRSQSFRDLENFFPDIDTDRLARVEDFHNGVARLLRLELTESETQLLLSLDSINSEIKALDDKMAASLTSIEQPSVIVDRVFDLATGIDTARHENDRFDDESNLRSEAKDAEERLSVEKELVLARVQMTVNEGMRETVLQAFGPNKKSPYLLLRDSNYSFETADDTGTGKAYSSLVVFDLTVFENTALPFLIHDTLLFKNIENDSVASLLSIYTRNWKQTFIALDEIEKYGPVVKDLLISKSVLRLDDEHVLFIKDWRKAS